MRVCKTCKEEKEESQFHRNGVYKPTGRIKYHPNCKQCDKVDRDVRAEEKLALVAAKTGLKCSVCGYNKCRAALELHHVDSETKEYGITDLIYDRTPIETLIKELEKCVMLCANCHREEHTRLRGF